MNMALKQPLKWNVLYFTELIYFQLRFSCCFSPDSDFVITLKLSSRCSYNTERQRGEIISEWCLYFHHHKEMTGGCTHKCGLGFISSFPLRLMFLCDILWSCCCLSGSHSCCRLRWAAAGGRGCVVGSWLIQLLFFGKLALVCVVTIFEWRKALLWLEKAFILPHEKTTLRAHSNLNSNNSFADSGAPKCPLEKAPPPSWPAALCSWFISGCFNSPVVYSRLLSRRFPH